jgi:hypothetical protein
MWLRARYLDGFTARRLRWELEVLDGQAALSAGWFVPGRPGPKLEASFEVDPSLTDGAVGLLTPLAGSTARTGTIWNSANWNLRMGRFGCVGLCTAGVCFCRGSPNSSPSSPSGIASPRS